MWSKNSMPPTAITVCRFETGRMMRQPVTGISRRAITLAVAVIAALAVAGCVPKKDDADKGYGLTGYNPASAESQKAACLAQGGQYLPAGSASVYTCFKTPKDAGKACSKSGDCESECLARSRSCAPIAPLFGCNSTLDAAGREVTLCRD